MKLHLHTQKVTLPCACGHKFKEELSHLKKDSKLVCKHCHNAIEIDEKKLHHMAGSLEKALAHLKQKLQ